MREHEILVEGKLYKVKLETCTIGAPFPVKVNDKGVEVQINGEPDSVTPYTVTIQGETYKVALSRIERRLPFQIEINEIPFNVQFKTTEKRSVRIHTPSPTILAPRPSRRTAEEGEILAPMAGKIVSIKVEKGDKVKLGDVLCTLEAMKMENEITATKLGSIDEINVSEGMTVNEGDLLMRIK